MNFRNATVNGQSATWKGIKAQYIAAACGLALAVSAIAGIVTFSSQDSDKATGHAGAIGSAGVSTSADLPMTFYYVVGSEERAVTLRTAINNAIMEAFVPGAIPSDYHVILADTPEREQLVALLFQDLNGVALQTGLITTNIIDLR